MINGFEAETNPLKPEELILATEISYILMNHVGEENKVNSTKIITTVNMSHKTKIDGARFRKIINHLRTSGMLKNLLATSGGYYIEPDIGKVQKYIDSLKHRGESILIVSESMQRQINPFQKKP